MRKWLWLPAVLVVVALAGTGVWLGLMIAGYGRPTAVAAAATSETSPPVQGAPSHTDAVGPAVPATTPTTPTKTPAKNPAQTTPPPVKITPPVKQPTLPAAPGTLEAGVEQAFTDFPGTWAVAVEDLQTGKKWILNGTERFVTASTVKIPVTLYAMAQQKAGRLNWDDKIAYTEEDFESPGGDLEESVVGDEYTVHELVDQAIMYSNNIAVNMLGRYLGWQNIRDWTKAVGGELYREDDGSPSATAANELAWWRYLYKASLNDPKTAALVLDPLHHVEYQGRIAAGLPPGTNFVHKYGSLDPYFHDSGMIWAKHPYSLVIMTNGGSEDEADVYISQVTTAIHAFMTAH